MPPTTHARLGASSSKRWMNCPGSIRMSEGMEDSGSIYARIGTAAHEVVEMTLEGWELGGLPADTSKFVGEYVSVWNDETGEDEAIEVTDEMAVAAQVMVDHVTERFVALQQKYGRHTVQLHLEQTFDLEPLGPPEPMFGTADVTLVVEAARYIEVIDYKHGQGVVVDAHENSQIMMYGLGATVAQGWVPDRIRTTIVQPRAHHEDGPIREYEFDRERLIEFKGELFAAAEATQAEDAPLNAGPWCRFCPAKATCPAQRSQAVALTGAKFGVQPEEFEAALPSAEHLTPEQIAEVLTKGQFIMDWIREVESYALTQMDHGNPIPGYKLVEGRSHRRWVDEEGAEQYLQGKGLKAADRRKVKLISPNQAEKALEAKGHSTDYLEKFWEKPAGKKKLAPLEDSRPALAPSVAAFDIEPAPTQEEDETNE